MPFPASPRRGGRELPPVRGRFVFGGDLERGQAALLLGEEVPRSLSVIAIRPVFFYISLIELFKTQENIDAIDNRNYTEQSDRCCGKIGFFVSFKSLWKRVRVFYFRLKPCLRFPLGAGDDSWPLWRRRLAAAEHPLLFPLPPFSKQIKGRGQNRLMGVGGKGPLRASPPERKLFSILS